MDARRLVAVGCLAHALVVCFVIVPIKALAFPAIGASPPVYVLLDPHVLWHGLQCMVAAITGNCSTTTQNLSGVFLSVTTRVGICICATVAGYWAVRWLSNQHRSR